MMYSPIQYSQLKSSNLTVLKNSYSSLAGVSHYEQTDSQSAYHVHDLESKRSDLITVQSEDINTTTRTFNQLKNYEIICFSLAAIGFGCGAIGYDINYVQEDLTEAREQLYIILMLISTISTAVLLLAIVFRTKAELRWEQSKGIYSWQDNLITTKKLNGLILEIIINSIHPVYGIGKESFPYYSHRYEVSIYYTYNEIFTIISIFRIYHIIRLLSVLSFFRSARAQRLCQINGNYAGISFAIKSMMKEQSLSILTVMLISGILCGGFCLRIFERPIAEESKMNFSNYNDAFWCAIVTMTTVGYGDYYPVTALGRVTVFIICIWGVFVVSLSVVSLSNLLVMDSGEEKSLLVMKRLKFKEKLKELAAYVLTSAVRYTYLIKNSSSTRKKHSVQLGRYRNYINEFHRYRIQSRSLYNYDSFEDRIEEKMDSVIQNEVSNMNLLNDMNGLIDSIHSKIHK